MKNQKENIAWQHEGKYSLQTTDEQEGSFWRRKDNPRTDGRTEDRAAAPDDSEMSRKLTKREEIKCRSRGRIWEIYSVKVCTTMAVVKCKCKYKFSVCTWWSFELQEQQELQEPKLPRQLEGMMGWLNWWVSTQVNLLKTSFLLLLEDQNDHDQPARQPTSQLVISNAFLETLVYPRRCVLVLVLVHVLAFCIDCFGGLLSLGKRKRLGKAMDTGITARSGEWGVSCPGWAQNLMQILCLHFPLLYLTCLTSLFVFFHFVVVLSHLLFVIVVKTIKKSGRNWRGN